MKTISEKFLKIRLFSSLFIAMSVIGPMIVAIVAKKKPITILIWMGVGCMFGSVFAHFFIQLFLNTESCMSVKKGEAAMSNQNEQPTTTEANALISQLV